MSPRGIRRLELHLDPDEPPIPIELMATMSLCEELPWSPQELAPPPPSPGRRRVNLQLLVTGACFAIHFSSDHAISPVEVLTQNLATVPVVNFRTIVTLPLCGSVMAIAGPSALPKGRS